MEKRLIAVLVASVLSLSLAGCASGPASSASSSTASSSEASSQVDSSQAAEAIKATLDLTEDYREGLSHGEKPAEYQKYIVLHDTEGEGEPEDIVNYFDGTESHVASHFVVGKDGHIVQCVPLDEIAHHAGFGDSGHNEEFGVEEDGRDDMVGTQSVGDWASDYGMNAWSIGIEMIHVGGSGDYPEEQLEALDELIDFIDAYYGFESQIIDHKAWRIGNSDTSPEFADYLVSYQDHRTHS